MLISCRGEWQLYAPYSVLNANPRIVTESLFVRDSSFSSQAVSAKEGNPQLIPDIEVRREFLSGIT
jgi:hypothetical protein